MNLKRKLLKTLLLAILLVVAIFYMPSHPGAINAYERFIFFPFQNVRGALFGFLPFSLGDLLYIAAGTWIIVTIVKWIKYIIRFRSHKEKLGFSLLATINTILFFYLLFFVGWGANYYKAPLPQAWGLAPLKTDTALLHNKIYRKQIRTKDSLALIAFDSFLVNKLNTYATHYRTLSFREINRRAADNYRQYTDCHVARFGLGIKPTLYWYFMQRLGIEGYYNPFTGEGQIDRTLPRFIMPFLVSHEMAHQAGVAAEDDANLVAYTVCTSTNDSSFRYSGYLEIWLYANYRLYRRDSLSAKKFESQLNRLTAAHIDTLEQLSKKYENEFARYSSDIYDSYLKMQDQKEGIRSYGNVASSAWLLEQKRSTEKNQKIMIP